MSFSPFVDMLSSSHGVDVVLDVDAADKQAGRGKEKHDLERGRTRRLCARAYMTWVYERLLVKHRDEMGKKKTKGKKVMNINFIVDDMEKEEVWKWTSLWFPPASGADKRPEEDNKVRGRAHCKVQMR